MKNSGDQWQVDDDLLTETGRGGLFTDGYLEGEPLVSYFERGETPLFVFGSGKRGVTRVDGEETRRIVPGSGYRAITALTDRRVQFVVGGGNDGRDWAADVRLSEIDRVRVDEGLIRSQLTITADGTDWKVYLRDVDTDRVVTFLEDASWAWIQVEELIADARKRLVDATQQQKSRSYEAAQATLADARSKLDEAADVADSLAAEASKGMRERISQIESRYRETKRRAFSSRATHLVDEAERHWRNEAYADAYETFVRAREQYREVLAIDDLESDKASAIRDRIEHVERNLQRLSSAPLEHAHETRQKALSASDPEAELSHWSSAFERYRTVLELDWGSDYKRFEGDVDLLRDRVAEAVEGMLDARRALASDCRSRGDDLIESGSVSEAREAYSDAISHLEAAVDLAEEFEPDAIEDLQDRLDTLGTCIEDATTSVAVADTDDSDAEYDDQSDDYDDFDNWVTLSPEDDSASDSADTDSTDASESTDPGETDDDGPPMPAEGPGPLAERLTDVSLPLQRTADRMDVDPEVVDAEAVDRLGDLDADEAVESVTDLWQRRGWSTTVVSGSDTVVLAEREEPSRESVVIVVVPIGPVSPEDIDRCVLQRDDAAADRGVLVSVADVADDARSRADAVGVELIDPPTLAAMLDATDLLAGANQPPVDRANADHTQ